MEKVSKKQKPQDKAYVGLGRRDYEWSPISCDEFNPVIISGNRFTPVMGAYHADWGL